MIIVADHLRHEGRREVDNYEKNSCTREIEEKNPAQLSKHMDKRELMLVKKKKKKNLANADIQIVVVYGRFFFSGKCTLHVLIQLK